MPTVALGASLCYLALASASATSEADHRTDAVRSAASQRATGVAGVAGVTTAVDAGDEPPPALYPDPAPPYPDEPEGASDDGNGEKSDLESAGVSTDDGPTQPPRPLTTITGHPPDEINRLHAAGGQITFTPDLAVRARLGAVSEFTLDRDGTQFTESAYSSGRVRWRPVLAFGERENVRIVGMLDIANGRWAPRESASPEVQEIFDDGSPPIPTDVRLVDPRELYLEWTTRAGQLRLGQMSFTWGQGIVANDGNNMDRFGDLKFGNDGDGSIQERILFGTKPLAPTGGPGKDIIIALGADLVYRDPNADLRQGDLAGQGIMVVRWEPEDRPGNWLGAYGAYRRQRSRDDGDVYPDDRDLAVGVLDFAGQGWRQSGKVAVLGAFEAAMITGRTTFASGDRNEHRVLQFGSAVRGYIGNPESWLVGFDGGAMSGDANPDDREIGDFEAAPGYTAGLLLFPFYRGWQSARAQLAAEDPDLVGVPPNGTQYVPTGGSVTNAIFIQPKVRWAIKERFEVWTGPLLAAAAVPVVDPYASRLSGGDAVSSLGGTPRGRGLGTELDLGLRGRFTLGPVWVMAGLQGAVLFPGRAIVDEDGGGDRPIVGGWFRTEIRY